MPSTISIGAEYFRIVGPKQLAHPSIAAIPPSEHVFFEKNTTKASRIRSIIIPFFIR